MMAPPPIPMVTPQVVAGVIGYGRFQDAFVSVDHQRIPWSVFRAPPPPHFFCLDEFSALRSSEDDGDDDDASSLSSDEDSQDGEVVVQKSGAGEGEQDGEEEKDGEGEKDGEEEQDDWVVVPRLTPAQIAMAKAEEMVQAQVKQAQAQAQDQTESEDRTSSQGARPSVPERHTEPEQDKTKTTGRTIASAGPSTRGERKVSTYVEYEVFARKVVVDNGSVTIKAGFAGEEEPAVRMPSVVGRPKMRSSFSASGSFDMGDAFVGSSAQAKRAIADISHPIQNGRITNWDDLELMWDHLFANELRLDSAHGGYLTNTPILMTEPPLNSKADRARMVETLLETYNAPGVCLAYASQLSVIAAGSSTGLVIDVGSNQTVVSPVYEDSVLRYNAEATHVGGLDIMDYLARLASTTHGSSFPTTPMFLTSLLGSQVEVATSSGAAQTLEERDVEAPDGNVFPLSSELSRAPELLFDPTLQGVDTPPLLDSVAHSLAHLDPELVTELLGNVILSGGVLTGLDARIKSELEHAYPSVSRVRVKSLPNPRDAPWRGGALLAAPDTFIRLCITPSEYAEQGERMLEYKFY